MRDGHRRRNHTWVAVALGLGACASGSGSADLPSETNRLARDLRQHRLVLLGEVHDNPHHHRLRHAALQAALAGDADASAERSTGRYRPALLMEQFDRERQPDIDRARRERPRDAEYLIAQAAPAPSSPGGAGWNWVFYKPFVQLALDYDLPLIAANASRADLFKVSKDGFGALFNPQELQRLRFDAPVPPALQLAQENAIATGHCNALPPQALGPMARAQIARDGYMALKLAEHATHGAVLIAGNGHVRRDLGAPRWLPEPMNPYVVIYVEPDAAGARGVPSESARADRVIVTEAVQRPDPCEAFRKSRAANREANK